MEAIQQHKQLRSKSAHDNRIRFWKGNMQHNPAVGSREKKKNAGQASVIYLPAIASVWAARQFQTRSRRARRTGSEINRHPLPARMPAGRKGTISFSTSFNAGIALRTRIRQSPAGPCRLDMRESRTASMEMHPPEQLARARQVCARTASTSCM